VTARRAGHAMHTALVSRLLRDRSSWELVHLPLPAPHPGATLPGHRRPQPSLTAVRA